MPRMFAVQLKDDAAERYEDSVSTPVYTQDFEECVGWLGDELPDKGYPCEFAKPAGDGATYCAAEVDKIRYENARLRELMVGMIGTGWREWLESNDIDVSDGSVPSDYLNMPSDERLFMELISNGTCYGGMTNAHEAVRDFGLGSVDR